MPRRPPGLKIYRELCSPAEVARLLEQCRSLPAPPNNPLFRYFGAFPPGPHVEDLAAWMPGWGQRMVERGLFKVAPNQYRVCNWIGDFSAQFKWHTDANRHGERILVISLTGSRAIGFRSRADRAAPYVLQLEAGDGYLIRATARWQWEHRVMSVGQGRGGGESFVLAYKR